MSRTSRAAFMKTAACRMAAPVGWLALMACTTAVGAAQTPLDRSVVPPPGATPAYDFPNPEIHTLSSGLEVWVVERPDLPLVRLQLLLNAGALAEPESQSGLASLTAAMLTQGTVGRSATQIAEELDFLAISLDSNGGQEFATVALSTLARNLDPALDLFADVIVNPAFAADEWNRVQQARLVALLQGRDQPETLANQQFARLVFSRQHPLGRPVQGLPETVQALDPSLLRAFHERFYRPENAHLIAVGDVSAADLLPRLERVLSGWQRGAAPVVSLPDPPAHQESTRVYVIDRPGATQSQIRIGHVGVERTHADYFPLLIMNMILGGQFTSRLNMNLREEKGYSYGAGSTFQMGRMAGSFVASAGVQTVVTAESVIEMMKEVREIRDARAPTAEEVAAARTSIIRREPLLLETNQQIANRLQVLIQYALPLDYFDRYTESIAAVTVEDVQRVAREYLHPDRFVIVVVGDRSAIEEKLLSLPYAVQIVEPDA